MFGHSTKTNPAPPSADSKSSPDTSSKLGKKATSETFMFFDMNKSNSLLYDSPKSKLSIIIPPKTNNPVDPDATTPKLEDENDLKQQEDLKNLHIAINFARFGVRPPV